MAPIFENIFCTASADKTVSGLLQFFTSPRRYDQQINKNNNNNNNNNGNKTNKKKGITNQQQELQMKQKQHLQINENNKNNENKKKANIQKKNNYDINRTCMADYLLLIL